MGVVHLIRTLPGGPQNFLQAFKDVYDDFKLFYDMKSFEEERTHCHNIERIYKRISPKLSRLLNRERAYELDTRISGLTGADFDIIEEVEPWMDEVEKIKTLLDQGKVDDSLWNGWVLSWHQFCEASTNGRGKTCRDPLASI